MSSHYRRDRTESPESVTYEIRQAWVEHNLRFRPKLTEFRTATLMLCTPKHLASKKATDAAIKQHAKNSLEYINGSMQSFKTYLETYCALTLIELLQSEGKHKEALKLRVQIEQAVSEMLKGEWKVAMEKATPKPKPVKEAKKPLKTSKKYNDFMNKKFNITPKKGSEQNA